MCLYDLEKDVQILSIMVKPSSLVQIKKTIQEDDDTAKNNCYKLLLNLLSRAFDSEPGSDFGASGGFYSAASSNNQEAKNDDQEIKNTVREELFEFMT